MPSDPPREALAILLDSPAPYAPIIEEMRRLQDARIRDEIPDLLLVLEHTPTVTLGRRGRPHGLLLAPDEYERRGIALHQATRGGDVTFHGPGQVVLYPIIRLGAREADSHGYLHNLEEIAIRTAADFGAEAYRRPGKSGAWTRHGKVAAIGFQLRRWVTSHGMSFNANIDLTGFSTIVPCGLVGEPVASLRSILGDNAPSTEAVRARLCAHFADVCDRPLLIRTQKIFAGRVDQTTGIL